LDVLWRFGFLPFVRGCGANADVKPFLASVKYYDELCQGLGVNQVIGSFMYPLLVTQSNLITDQSYRSVPWTILFVVSVAIMVYSFTPFFLKITISLVLLLVKPFLGIPMFLFNLILYISHSSNSKPAVVINRVGEQFSILSFCFVSVVAVLSIYMTKQVDPTYIVVAALFAFGGYVFYITRTVVNRSTSSGYWYVSLFASALFLMVVVVSMGDDWKHYLTLFFTLDILKFGFIGKQEYKVLINTKIGTKLTHEYIKLMHENPKYDFDKDPLDPDYFSHERIIRHAREQPVAMQQTSNLHSNGMFDNELTTTYFLQSLSWLWRTNSEYGSGMYIFEMFLSLAGLFLVVFIFLVLNMNDKVANTVIIPRLQVYTNQMINTKSDAAEFPRLRELYKVDCYDAVVESVWNHGSPFFTALMIELAIIGSVEHGWMVSVAYITILVFYYFSLGLWFRTLYQYWYGVAWNQTMTRNNVQDHIFIPFTTGQIVESTRSLLLSCSLVLWTIRLLKIFLFMSSMQPSAAYFYIIPKVALHIACLIPPLMLRTAEGNREGNEDQNPNYTMKMMGASLLLQSGCEMSLVLYGIICLVRPGASHCFSAPRWWHRVAELANLTQMAPA